MNFLKNGAALLFGGLSFWAPTVGVELITRRELNPVVGTILPPAAVMCAYLLLQRTRPGLFTSWTSIRMLARIYGRTHLDAFRP
jgi:hypothetical protein